MTDQVQATPFTEPTPVAPVAEPVAPVLDPVQAAPALAIPEELKDLVGEGKKYATAEEALKSIPHAQQHIGSMEQEMADMREDLAKRKAVEEVLQEINKTPTDIVPEPQITEDQLDALIDNRLTAKTFKDKQDANTSEVINTFVDMYGDKEKAQEIYVKKAADLGLSIEQLNTLSASSPQAVYTMFGMVKPAEQAPTQIHSNVNTEANINTQQAPQAPKSVMGRSTHKDDISAWNAAKPTE